MPYGAQLAQRSQGLAQKLLQEKFKRGFLVQRHLIKNSDSDLAVDIKNVFVIFSWGTKLLHFNFAGLLVINSCQLREKGVSGYIE